MEYLGRRVEERTRVLTMHGETSYWADEAEFMRLVRLGYVEVLGTAKRIHRLKLRVPVEVALELSSVPESVLKGPRSASKTTWEERIGECFYLIQHKSVKGLCAADFSIELPVRQCG